MSSAPPDTQKANGTVYFGEYGAVHVNPNFQKESTVNSTTSPYPSSVPKLGTMAHRALAELACRGPVGLSSPEFQALTGSWRLASSVHTLRQRGWPIVTNWVRHPRREFARYTLAKEV